MRRAVLISTIALATTLVAGQTAAGIRLVDVRFSGGTRAEGLDLRKCAADLKLRTYEGPEWLDEVTQFVLSECVQAKGYLKALVKSSIERLPDEHGTHRFVVTFDIDAGPQYRMGQISFTNNHVFSTEELRSMFDLASGDLLNTRKIRQGLDRMRKAYMERGYRDFTPVPDTDIDDTRHLVSIAFDCDEGKQWGSTR